MSEDLTLDQLRAASMREHAACVGADNPGRAWILTDYDVYVPNPFYTGPPQLHPEDACYDES